MKALQDFVQTWLSPIRSYLASALAIAVAIGAVWGLGYLAGRSAEQVSETRAATAASARSTDRIVAQTHKNMKAADAAESEALNAGNRVSKAVDRAVGGYRRVSVSEAPPTAGFQPQACPAPGVDPDVRWRAFVAGYNSVLDAAAAGTSVGAPTYSRDGTTGLSSASPGSE